VHASLRVFEFSAIAILHVPPPELSKAHLGSLRVCVCACVCVRVHVCVCVCVTANPDPSVKSPGVPVKVLIRLVQIKRGWHSLGTRGGGAIPQGPGSNDSSSSSKWDN